MFYFLFVLFLWGIFFIVGKFVYEILDFVLVVLFRLIIVGVILFFIILRFIKENSKFEVNW